ncbi:glucosaminidase domain-containing protein [Hydrogenovibrio kuenenii]|uniref:glucosaminidase domain-containing protein n=1 Tax=Hydrogenovibrio kuenenii TaxID=63658 RepID=UPI0004662679|nr:glucosaminidase domain-containing protein [Hydrogenovibrio kuenenii]
MKIFILILSAISVFLIARISIDVQANSAVLTKKSDSSSYSLRKYPHVKQFYGLTAKEAVKIGLKENIPPAAILAIAGWESGYGQGYVAQITGNIMSLGARKGEPELPPLTLPKNVVKNKIMIDINKAKQLPKGQVVWQKRPPSLKKDYRPEPYAGTKNNLLYFKKNPKALKLAYAHVMWDFSSSWVSEKSKVPVFFKASKDMDKLVKTKGKSVLLDCNVSKKFVKSIGGKPRSFNIRPAWIKHVYKVMDNAGLCALTQEIYKGKSFKQAWSR